MSFVSLVFAWTTLSAYSPADAVPGATPTIAEDPAPCGPVLARLQGAGAALGYSVRDEGSGFTGSRGADRLDVACSTTEVVIEVVEPAGPLVSVHFARAVGPGYVLELVGQFPGLGHVSQTATVDEKSRGTLTFVADAGDRWAFAEFDLEGERLADGGDPAVVNDRFAPVLSASHSWQDAQKLTLALAGMWGPGAAQPVELEVALAVAVPDPRDPRLKKSILGQAMTCGTATLTCTAAAYGFAPAAGSCVNSASACALAVACALVSCLD
jgi:hypothetical protein